MRNTTLIGQTSDPIAGYRRQSNTSTFALSRSYLTSDVPQAAFKNYYNGVSFYRALVANVVVIQMPINSNNRSPEFYRFNRANLQLR